MKENLKTLVLDGANITDGTIQQFLQWQITINIVSSVICIICIIALSIFAYRFWNYKMFKDKDFNRTGFVTSLLVMLLPVLFLATNIYYLIQIYTAPSVFLINFIN